MQLATMLTSPHPHHAETETPDGGSGPFRNESFATVRLHQEAGHAVVVGDGCVGDFLARPDWREIAGGSGVEVALSEVVLGPLVRQPKIICVGLNYRTHVEEMGRGIPDHPTLFAKYPDALCLANDDLVLPPESSRVDWEAELVVVIGRNARRVAQAEALSCVAGYTVANDVSMRDWQNRTIQFLQGKTWEHTTPLGAVLTTPEDVDHARNLRIGCTVNGSVRQDSNTADLLFDVPTLVSYISTFTTLRPGDIILTGTPGGVGAGMQPPQFLQPGDLVEVFVDGLGSCRNACVAG